MLRYALRNLARRRVRTLMGLSGVLVTAGLLTAFEIGIESVTDALVALASLQGGEADATVAPWGTRFGRGEAFESAPVSASVAAVPGVRGSAPRLVERVEVRAFGALRGAFLVGIRADLESSLGLGTLEPSPRLGEGRCAVSEALARRLGARPGAPLAPGSRLDVTGPTGALGSFTVDAVVSRQRKLPAEMREFVVLDLDDAAALLASAGDATLLAVSFAGREAIYDSRDIAGSVARARAIGGRVGEAAGLRYEVRLPKAEALSALGNFAAPLRAAFGVFALSALGIAALLLYSLLSIAVEERIREHAILRVLGARRGRVFLLVLLDSCLLCAAGAAGGAAVGILLARLGLLVAGRVTGAGAEIALRLSPWTLLSTLGAGAAMALGGALAPALRATRLPIVAGLDPLRRGEIRDPGGPDRRVHRPLVLLGAALAAVSGTIFFVLPAAFLSGNRSLLGSLLLALLLLMLAGFTLAAFGVLPAVEGLVLAPLRPLLGAARDLVGVNLRRYRRRNGTTSLLFALSVAFVFFVASLGTILSRQAWHLAEWKTGADLRIGPATPEEEAGLRADVESTPGVAKLARVRRLLGRSSEGVAYDIVLADLAGLGHVWVQLLGVDESFRDVVYRDRIGYEAGSEEAWAALAADDGPVLAAEDAGEDPPGGRSASGEPVAHPIVLSAAVAGFLGVTAGDPVQLVAALGPVHRRSIFRVEAVITNLPGFEAVRANTARAVGSAAIVGLRTFDRVAPVAREGVVRTDLLASVRGDGETVAREVRDGLSPLRSAAVGCTAENRREARNAFWALQLLSSALLVMAVVIAFFALVANVSTSVVERRRELGVLKALGLRRGDLRRMLAGEAVVLTLAAGAVGACIGYVLAYGFVLEASVLSEMPVPFAVPVLLIGTTVAVCLVSGVLAARAASARLLRGTAAEILLAS